MALNDPPIAGEPRPEVKRFDVWGRGLGVPIPAGESLTVVLASDYDKDLATLRAQLAEALDWKESAMKVESEWDCQGVAAVLGLPIGSSIRAGIMPAIRALKSQLAEADSRAEDMSIENTLLARQLADMKERAGKLEAFAMHHPKCARKQGRGYCDCGLEAALSTTPSPEGRMTSAQENDLLNATGDNT